MNQFDKVQAELTKSKAELTKLKEAHDALIKQHENTTYALQAALKEQAAASPDACPPEYDRKAAAAWTELKAKLRGNIGTHSPRGDLMIEIMRERFPTASKEDIYYTALMAFCKSNDVSTSK